ncbi:Solute carrier family 40 member 1 [Colletotrichum sp. SAR 10_70]|nr:Solute carrier family 40 member 1 [Colletotrichum sp. SAR 10_71]KAI8199656.1 Solute carrier family 40 member 1 [Colletotrichum sp. SAR 10_70]
MDAETAALAADNDGYETDYEDSPRSSFSEGSYHDEPISDRPRPEGYRDEEAMMMAPQHDPTPAAPSISKPVVFRLYVSHFLSTWNSRLFEFGAVLFLASIYPGTLMPMSIYALVRGVFAVILSPSIGSWIDRGNRLSVVVVITEGNEKARQELNARIRRIDLFCKLIGPLAISLIDGASTTIAIWVTLSMTLLSVVTEYLCIARVYQLVPALAQLRAKSQPSTPADSDSDGPEDADVPQTQQTTGWLKSKIQTVFPVSAIPFYFSHPALRPSLSLALLYFTVLSFSGQMITFLLSVGYNSFHIGIARTISTVFELSATWAAPKLMDKIGPIRAGIWSLSWQMIWLAAGDVDEEHRGAFSTVEASMQSVFELLSYAATVVFSRPDQFQWPILMSVGAIYAAGGLYASYVRKRRGHLFHAPPCLHCKKEES